MGFFDFLELRDQTNMLTEFRQLVGPKKEQFGYTILHHGNEREAHLFHYSPFHEIEGEAAKNLEGELYSVIPQQNESTLFYIDTTIQKPTFKDDALISIPSPLNFLHVIPPEFGDEEPSVKEQLEPLSIPYWMGYRQEKAQKKWLDFYVITRRTREGMLDLFQEMKYMERAIVESRLQPEMNFTPIMFEHCHPQKFDFTELWPLKP